MGAKNAILDMPSSFFKLSSIQYDKQLKWFINTITWNEYSVEGFFLMMLSHTTCIGLNIILLYNQLRKNLYIASHEKQNIIYNNVHFIQVTI